MHPIPKPRYTLAQEPIETIAVLIVEEYVSLLVTAPDHVIQAAGEM